VASNHHFHLAHLFTRQMDKLSRSIKDEKFDPFGNRLCRDIRNQLSKEFIQAIDTGDIKPITKTAEHFLNRNLKPYMGSYIKNRLKLYGTILQQVEPSQKPTQNMIALQLWNKELFYEFHELVEKEWMHTTGTEKKALQTLIRSAGAYILLNSGRKSGAIKMASKAIDDLKEYRNLIPRCFDVDLLIKRLSALDSNPPKF
jgi:hypothetical protein